MNNRERINQMNNKEMAELLSNMPCSYCLASDYCHNTFDFSIEEFGCTEVIKKWLEGEVK